MSPDIYKERECCDFEKCSSDTGQFNVVESVETGKRRARSVGICAEAVKHDTGDVFNGAL